MLSEELSAGIEMLGIGFGIGAILGAITTALGLCVFCYVKGFIDVLFIKRKMEAKAKGGESNA